MLPLLAAGAALAWPQAHGGAIQAVLAVAPAATTSPTPACTLPVLTCPTPTPSPTPTPTPTPKPKPTPTLPYMYPSPYGGSSGVTTVGGGPRAVPPPATVARPAVTAPTTPGSGNLVGLSSGPAEAPTVPGSRLDILSDPSSPQAGDSALITVTLSGSRGADRYAVPKAPIALELVEKPDGQASLSATHLTTDVTGSVTARLTLSRARGRYVLKASYGSLSNQLLLDTLTGTRASTGRARHDGTIRVQAIAPVIDPSYLVAAAVLTLVVSFLLPYRRRVFRRRRRGDRAGVAAAARVAAIAPGARETSTGAAAATAVMTGAVEPAPSPPPPALRPRKTGAARKPAAPKATRAAPPVSSGRKTPRARRSAAPDA